MKAITRLLVLLLVLSISFSATSQNCNYYYPLNANTKMQYQTFNSKNKLESTQEVLISDVKNVGNSLEATISTKIFDNKNKLVSEGEYIVSCSGNEISFDMSAMIDQSILKGFEGMEVQIEASDMTIPSDLVVGNQLKDATMKMIVKAGPMTISDMTITVKNRKVESKENITTPAGTYESFKVTHDYIIVSKAMGMTTTINSKSVDYMVKDLGTVRSESYDEKGVLQSYSVLSKIF
ncbi:MAG: hypothetical protein KGZ97_08435 [Bacteroidetes bacterium]|nr:hypothetical protein [Bacteroidota bacterium]